MATEYKAYTGGNAELDEKLSQLSNAYSSAKAAGNAAGMQQANETANQLRNSAGYSAELATQDITSTANQAAQNAVSGASAPANDYSDYVEGIYDAQRQAKINALSAAYQNNVATLDASAAKIAPTYQAARNQTAGTSEQNKRNFAEYAAASGLNSGASGQAELARGVTLQNNLNTIDAAEADAYSALELKRTQLANEYNAAIASAEADGDYELSNALYQEAIRADNALTAQRQYQQQMQYQQSRDAVSDARYQQNLASEQDNTQYNRSLQTAQLLAQYGDFSGYAALGIDTTQMEAAYRANQTASGGGGGGKPTLTYADMVDAMEAGQLTPNVLAAYQYYMGQPYSGTAEPTQTEPTAQISVMTDSEFNSFLNSFGRKYASASPTATAEQIYNLYASGRLNDAQYSRLVSMFGLD